MKINKNLYQTFNIKKDINLQNHLIKNIKIGTKYRISNIAKKRKITIDQIDAGNNIYIKGDTYMTPILKRGVGGNAKMRCYQM